MSQKREKLNKLSILIFVRKLRNICYAKSSSITQIPYQAVQTRREQLPKVNRDDKFPREACKDARYTEWSMRLEVLLYQVKRNRGCLARYSSIHGGVQGPKGVYTFLVSRNKGLVLSYVRETIQRILYRAIRVYHSAPCTFLSSPPVPGISKVATIYTLNIRTFTRLHRPETPVFNARVQGIGEEGESYCT